MICVSKEPIEICMVMADTGRAVLNCGFATSTGACKLRKCASKACVLNPNNCGYAIAMPPGCTATLAIILASRHKIEENEEAGLDGSG